MLRSTLLFLVVSPTAFAADKFEFKDGDKVVLIGSTLIEREQRYGYWEAALTARNPDKNITFRNLGWSGDTVWGEARAGFGTPADGYKQLIEHVKAEKPTVIVVGYGTNESFAGEAGLPKFKEQLKKLLDDLAVTKARFVLMSPMRMLKMPPPIPDPTKANSNIELYGKAIDAEATARNSLFVDLSVAFDPQIPFSELAPATLNSENGLHLTAHGYYATGGFLAASLQNPSLFFAKIDAKNRQCEVKGARAIKDGDSSRFRIITDHLLIPIVIDSKIRAPGRLFQVTGLGDARYTMVIDGRSAETGSAEEWGKVAAVTHTPEWDQGEQLRQAVIAKNELYFHRWRPQNVTYLFGFRKHEQGNNAGEIPKFDPLIEAKEKEIAKLRVPREHVYELVPAKEEKKKEKE
jgi:lysophospholipase L1-like esterase